MKDVELLNKAKNAAQVLYKISQNEFVSLKDRTDAFKDAVELLQNDIKRGKNAK